MPGILKPFMPGNLQKLAPKSLSQLLESLPADPYSWTQEQIQNVKGMTSSNKSASDDRIIWSFYTDYLTKVQTTPGLEKVSIEDFVNNTGDLRNNPGGYAAWLKTVKAEAKEKQTAIDSDIKVFNNQLARKDYTGAQTTLDNILVSNPDYDISTLQAKIPVPEVKADPNTAILTKITNGIKNGMLTDAQGKTLTNLVNSGYMDIADSKMQGYITEYITNQELGNTTTPTNDTTAITQTTTPIDSTTPVITDDTTGTKNEDVPKFDYSTYAESSGLNTIEASLQEIIDRGEPTFLAPTRTGEAPVLKETGYTGEAPILAQVGYAGEEPTLQKPGEMTGYTQKWLTQLEQLETPQVQQAMTDINKQVGEQYAFYNPYSLGSGTQIKATQDAATELMTNVIANRNAKALALGQTEYSQDYDKALNDYTYAKAQRENQYEKDYAKAMGDYQLAITQRENKKQQDYEQAQAEYQYSVAQREGDYQKSYDKSLIDQSYEQAKLANAQQKLQDMAQYKIDAAKMASDTERTDYYNLLSRKWQTADTASQQAYNKDILATENKYQQQAATAQQNYTTMMAGLQNKYQTQATQGSQDYSTAMANYQNILNRQNTASDRAYGETQTAQQQRDAQQIASMYQPQEQSWYQQLLTPIVTGIGYGVGGGVGGAIASGITNMFKKTPTQTPPQYNYSSSLNLPGYKNIMTG